MFKLTKCRRSDQAHFNFYTNLHENLEIAKTWTRAKYMQGSPGGSLHLVISHRKRRALNEKLQDTFAGDSGLIIGEFDTEAAYRCITGTPLVGSCTSRGIVNGAFYEVICIDPLKLRDTLNGNVTECTVEQLPKLCVLAHAVVYNRAQGLTIHDKHVVLHCFGSCYFRRAHLYVGLSRVKSGSQIRLAA